MRQRYRHYRRGNNYYSYDNETRQGESLRTVSEDEARRIVQAKNEALRQPQINRQIAKAYLNAGDPTFAARTWQNVMDEAGRIKTGETKARWERAMREAPFDLIRNRRLIETHPEHFFDVLAKGTTCTKIFLRRLHNFALDLNWILAPVLPKRRWPKIEFKEKRAITLEEHQKIVAGEANSEWRAYYEALWHIGGAQTDTACLGGENFERADRILSYHRKKTGSLVQLHYGESLAKLLETLPPKGLLFPNIARMKETDRAKAFIRRCRLVGVKGVSLHCYPVAWAERALVAGYPERFAQEALGHRSRAVHRAYAKKAQVKLPPLEQFEKAAAQRKVITVEFSPPARANGEISQSAAAAG
jgi:hypothetical protein